jgi:glycolate oxidase
MLISLRKIADKHKLTIVNFGHAGDGNIHVNIMTDRENKEEYSRAQSSIKEIFEATLNLGGSISGEHGVGLSKKSYIEMQLPVANIELMKSIKKAFDPRGILNPGKIFPDE